MSCQLCRLALLLGVSGLVAADQLGDLRQFSSPDLPPDTRPVRVLVDVYVNNILSIREVDETYTLDGYLRATWRDSRVARPSGDRSAPYMEVLGDNVTAVLGSRVWWPYFEFINIIGAREVQNRSLSLYPDGKVVYTDSFRATFSSEMDFRQYPFDQQYFTIGIESYLYDTSSVVFAHLDGGDLHAEPIEEWKVLKTQVQVEERCFVDLEGPSRYSRFTLGIVASRIPDYFYYQFFLPLFLIVASSWIVFWLKSFSDQLTIAFTLMLTVVAFNFFTSTLLPRLPYNTFIETAVLSGYLSIFAAIVVVVVRHAGEARYALIGDRGFSACRWLFPLVYIVVGGYVGYEMIIRPEWQAPATQLQCDAAVMG